MIWGLILCATLALASGALNLVFEDKFDGSFNAGNWSYEVSLSGGGNHEFQAYTPEADNIFNKDGKLYIKPTLTSSKYGEAFLTTGVWDMQQKYGYCTNGRDSGCRKEGKYGLMNPIMSGRIQSKVAIKYGKVEVRAKMPRGDWIWPAIWMLPQDWKYGGWPQSGEIDIMEAIGNRDFGTRGIAYMGSTLHWGANNVNRFHMTHASKKAASGTLADGMHTYTLEWDENGMDFYLDGAKVLRVNTPAQGFWTWGNIPGKSNWPNKNSPFDQRFYLILNVAVGGTNGFIPDNVNNAGYQKPWRNNEGEAKAKFWRAKNQWWPTWQGPNDDSSMQVDYVRMWQKV